MRPAESGGHDFDDWLRRQFALTLGPERGRRGHPADALYASGSRTSRRKRRAPRSSMLATVGAKAVIVAAAAVLATGGAAAAVATGNVKPASWGQHVVETVRGCQADRGDPGSGTRGIGGCVSTITRQHGAQHRSGSTSGAHKNAAGAPSSLPGKRLGQPQNGPPGGNGAPGAGQGQGAAHGDSDKASHGH